MRREAWTWPVLLVAAAVLAGSLLGGRRAAAGQAPRQPVYQVVYLSREMILSDKLLHDEINAQAADGWQYVDTIYGWRTDLSPARTEPRFMIYRR